MNDYLRTTRLLRSAILGCLCSGIALFGSATILSAQAPQQPTGERKPRVVDPADNDVQLTTPAVVPSPAPSATPSPTVPIPVPTGTGTTTTTTQKTIAVPPAEIKPTVPGVEPTNKELTPQPTKITVKETQPAAGVPAAAPDGKPVLSAPAPAPETLVYAPKDRYYMMIFGSESVPRRARFTHTWMTIVKATPKPGKTDAYDVLAHTISWMPRSLDIRVLAFRPECGVNLTLQQTLDYVRCQGECVAMWGPYELNPTVAVDVYNRSVKQIARLNSGRVLYKARDPDTYPQMSYVSNCIHAVTDLDGIGRRSMMYDETRYFGIAASSNLARIMAGADRLDTSLTHDWLIEALDIQRYRMSRRLLPKPKPVPQPVTAQQEAACESLKVAPLVTAD